MLLRTIVLTGLLLTIPGAGATTDGARLFAQNCAACHGDNGTGGIGVPLALPSFQATISDDYLRRTIRNGRPGRVMPAFPQLRDNEIEALVQYVRRWHRGPTASYPADSIAGNRERGKSLFAKRCANCHGANGEGGRGTGVTFSRPRDLPIMAPALNNPGFLASAPDAMIKATLVQGREGTPMVSFLKHGLNDGDIDDIVSFVRSFDQAPRTAPAPETGQAVLEEESPYDLNTTVENVKRAVAAHNFVFIREQPLNAGLAPGGKEDPRQHIVYFCNFNMLNKALATDPRVGLFLPCRITVVEHQGKVKMMAVNPRRLSKIFNNAELNAMCDEMSRLYVDIMEEAAL